MNGGFNNIVNKNVWNSTPAQTQQIVHGACLDTTDLEALKCFVQDFAVRALIPYAEQHISSINDIVSTVYTLLISISSQAISRKELFPLQVFYAKYAKLIKHLRCYVDKYKVNINMKCL